MKLWSYKRVVLLLAGLVVFVQLSNLSAVLTTIGSDERNEMRQDLLEAAGLVEQLTRRRSEQLLTSAQVLAADYGCRSAIASSDATTILSALRNNIQRIDADLATLVTVDGFARDVVSVPVNAPLTIGWLVLGFSLDDRIAETFAQQAGMHVSFTAGSRQFDYFGSSLDVADVAVLPSAMQRVDQTDAGAVTTLKREEFLTQLVPINTGIKPVVVILHTSLHDALASYRGVRNRLLAYMGVGLVVALTLALWFARGVTRPVELFSIAALRIREGDYRPELDKSLDSQRGDEFGALIKTFADMQTGIAEREATITYHAYHDELSGLPKRRRAQEHLSRSTDRRLREGGQTAVILPGMDRYRQIVESLGHPVGEAMLKAVGRQLEQQCADVDLAAWGAPDEFLVLMSDPDVSRAELRTMAWLDALQMPVYLA